MSLAVLVAAGCSGDNDTATPRPPSTRGSVSTMVADEPDRVEPETEPSATATGGSVSWRDRIDETCATLRSEGFETRKLAVQDVEQLAGDEAPDARASLQVACADALDRLTDAIDLEARRDRLDRGDAPVSISDLRCADGTYQFVATNETDHPIGVHGGFRIFVGDDDEPVSSADYPIVIWELGAGESQGITGEFHEPDTDEGYRCNLTARAFDAADDDADAAIPGVVDESLTGDEPEDWFGALLGREVDGVGSGDIDAAAETEDLRSTFYDNVLDANLGSDPVDRVPTSVKICRATVDRPDADRVSFVYYVTYPTADGGEEGLLRHGLFRRGADGQWRWLSAAQYFDSPDFWSCGRPGPVG